jgi:hypothetical protein
LGGGKTPPKQKKETYKKMKKLTPLGEVDSTEELRKQVAELTKMVEALSKSTAEPKQPRVAKTKEMIPNEYVKVMSLVGNKLNLSTRHAELEKHLVLTPLVMFKLCFIRNFWILLITIQTFSKLDIFM